MALQIDSAQLDIRAILQRLPHRFPFLLVDRVLELRVRESIRALKNVTYNEPFFAGHFPGWPLMPGVMIIEALAQATGIRSQYRPPIPSARRRQLAGAQTRRASRPGH